jgi:uncharacterized protein (DUF1501 family)
MLRLASLGIGGGPLSAWLPLIAKVAAADPQRTKACILLWMTGGPSQLDTLDPKPGHANGGPVRDIETVVPGIRISEYLPKLAQQVQHVAAIRSMSTREGDHARAMHVLRTGRLPQGPIHYPTLGSFISKALGPGGDDLPDFVSIAPYRPLSPAAFGPGFLGPQHGPLVVGGSGASVLAEAGQATAPLPRVENLSRAPGVNLARADARYDLLRSFDDDYAQARPGPIADGHRAAWASAVQMMRSPAVSAFELSQEPASVLDAYGRNQFGQGCLLARRLIERGVPFVEVSLNGAPGSNALAWDTHRQNFDNVPRLCEVLDGGWATLLADLAARGLLESTLVVWMGEFGRTPRINPQQGRDHYPIAWSTALCGGGLRTGQTVGRTSGDGMQVVDRPVTTADFLATICLALGIDPQGQNMSNIGRPIRLVEPDAKPIQEVLA